ncbi:uncharacterized protein PG986_008470 [Apiospora aurea]|uniref:Uncharacterized protein n=1 Tax=Apiospora aurea TaxID=335848 RepID=A0ABR1QFS8_9PEZI
MSGSTDPSKGSKRLGLEESPGDRPNKSPRVAQPVFNPSNGDEDRPHQGDGRHKDDCASQTFVAGDDRLVTDSITNNARRHNGEIAQQDNTLEVILNAHHGFEKQLLEHDDQLADAKKSIKDVKKNCSKKALDQVTRVDEKFKQEIATVKETMQTQFDAINRKTTQHNIKVHQTLSAVAKCLQELGYLTEPAVEEDQPAAVQGDSGSRQSQNAGTNTDQGFVYSNGSLQVDDVHYLSWLASLDFRPPSGIAQYKNATLRFHERDLFINSCGSRYYITVNSVQLPPISKRSRKERGHNDDDGHIARPSHKQAYRDNILELEPRKATSRPLVHPRYILPLGHLCVNQPTAADPIHWTGFHVVVDVTNPSKSLWLVHCSKSESSKGPDDHVSWPFGISGVMDAGFDLIALTPSVKWVDVPQQAKYGHLKRLNTGLA